MDKRTIWAAASGLLTGGALLLSAPALYAQGSEDSAELEEVLVTAEKRETNLQKTSISIQVYQGEDLKLQGKKRIDEIMSGVVGVQARDSQVGNVFFVRGVDAGGGGGPAATGGNTVSVLIDGIYQSRGETVRGGSLDVAQVEVMRGTQSTNLGVNALAGAVSLVTNKPVLGEYLGNASIEVGNYNLYNIEAIGNIPVGETQAIRMAFSKNERDGYLASGAGDSDILNARIKYLWKPSETFSAVFTGSHQHIGGNGVQQGVNSATGVWQSYNPAVPYCTAVITANCYLTSMGPRTTATSTAVPILGLFATPGRTYLDRSDPWDDGYPADLWPNNPYRNTRITTWSADLNWSLPFGSLTVLPSYEDAQLNAVEPPRGVGDTFNGQFNPQKTRQLDVRLASNSDGRLEWQGGMYYYHTNQTGPFMGAVYPGNAMYNDCNTRVSSTNLTIVSAASGLCVNWTETGASITETKSLYGDATFDVTDTFRVQAGIRYSDDRKQNDYSLNPNQGGYNYVGTLTGPTRLQRIVPVPATVPPTVPAPPPVPVDFGPFNGYTMGSYEYSWDDLSYSLGVQYDVTDSAMVYAAYKTGYQPGGLNTMGALNGAPNPTFSVKNTTKQATVGFKSRWLDNRLQFNTEFFDMTFKNRPFGNATSTFGLVYAPGFLGDPACLTFGPGSLVGTPQVPNNFSCMAPNHQLVADNDSRGVDLEVSWLPTAAARLDVAIEWLDANYSSRPTSGTLPFTVTQITTAALGMGVPTAAQTAAAQVLLNEFNRRLDLFAASQLQNAPKYSLNAAYSHRFTFAGGSSLTPRINMEYKDDYWSQGGTFAPSGFGQVGVMDAASLVLQPSYSLWNANVVWQSADSKFTLTGYVNNIANKPIAINIGGEPGVRVNYVSLSPPRTFGVILGAQF